MLEYSFVIRYYSGVVKGKTIMGKTIKNHLCFEYNFIVIEIYPLNYLHQWEVNHT